MDSRAFDPSSSDGGLSSPCNRGGYADGWFAEEASGSHGLRVKVREHLHTERSPYQKIDVYASDFFGRFLTLDDLMMLTERDEFVYHEMLVHVPLCCLPAPRDVLVIGGGDLGCVREALRHPTVERVVLCEIDERVTRVCEEWFPWVRETAADPRVSLVFDDGVRYVEEHPGDFDLIVVDSTDPVGPAVGLFLGEFYDKVRRALKPGGVMTAQSETPHWDAGMVGSIYAELGRSFERVRPYLGFIPTYPSGMWSWAFASGTVDPLADLDEARAEAIAADSRYYDRELHRAAFALPRFVQKAVRGENVFERWDRAARERYQAEK